MDEDDIDHFFSKKANHSNMDIVLRFLRMAVPKTLLQLSYFVPIFVNLCIVGRMHD